MKLSKADTAILVNMQNRMHGMIDRLRKQKVHEDAYQTGYEDDKVCSIVQQLYAASSCLEMILERLDD